MFSIGLLNTHYSLHIVTILYTGITVAIKTGHVLNDIKPFEISTQQFCVLVSETRQAMYVQRNNEARSCNYCCSGKEINITYSEPCVCSLLLSSIQSACAVLYRHMWPVCLSVCLYYILPQHLKNGKTFG